MTGARVYSCFLNLDLRWFEAMCQRQKLWIVLWQFRTTRRQAIVSMLEQNTTLLYLGFDCDDAAGLHLQFIQRVFCNFVKIYVCGIFFFRLEDLRQRLQMPLQRLWKGTSPGRESAVFSAKCESGKFGFVPKSRMLWDLSKMRFRSLLDDIEFSTWMQCGCFAFCDCFFLLENWLFHRRYASNLLFTCVYCMQSGHFAFGKGDFTREIPCAGALLFLLNAK